MSGPQRKPDQIGISVSMSKALLADIDARRKLLGLTRSQYLASLARNDLAAGGELVIREISHSYSSPTAPAPAPQGAGAADADAARILGKYPKATSKRVKTPSQ